MGVYGYLLVKVTPENKRSLLREHNGISVIVNEDYGEKVHIPPSKGVLRYEPSIFPETFFIEHGTPRSPEKDRYTSRHDIEHLSGLWVGALII